MKFGKLPDIRAVDFSLPPDHPDSEVFLSSLQGKATSPHLQVFLGATGWSMKEWVGKIYPPKTQARDFLTFYAKQFNSIELNTTHYRIPSPVQVEKWKQQVPSDFRFCPKVPQLISHGRHLGLDTPHVDHFLEVIAALDDRLGCCFLQLPPYFDTSGWERLEKLLDYWPSASTPLALEFRHASWFEDPGPGRPAFQRMEELGFGLVITDVAGRRDVLHMRISAPFSLVRFVGNGLHETDYQRADAWVQRLARWAESGLQQVFFFPHQPDNLLAPNMIDYFSEKLGDWDTITTRGPNGLTENQQTSLF
jgi:uncharacterized protein YecE (DUF72 family)